MFVYLVFHTFLFRRNVSQLQNMQIALIPQDERKLPKLLRASSLPLRISKYLTPFKTNPIENLDIKCLSVNTRGLNKSIKRRSVFRWFTTKMYTLHFFKNRTVRNLALTHGQPNGVARFSLAMVQRTAKA